MKNKIIMKKKIENILNEGKKIKNNKKEKNVKSIIKTSISINPTNINNKDKEDNITITNDYQIKSLSNLFKNRKKFSLYLAKLM